MKKCYACGKNKNTDEFMVVPMNSDGASTCCLLCRSKTKKTYKPNPSSRRDRNLKYRYGMTHKDYLILLADQGGECAICGIGIDGYRSREHFDVDHDHNTGEVRGLLCVGCNIHRADSDEDYLNRRPITS